MVINTLAIDGWIVTFGTVRRGLDGLWLLSHPGCTKCNSPPINSQCTNAYYSIFVTYCGKSSSFIKLICLQKSAITEL